MEYAVAHGKQVFQVTAKRQARGAPIERRQQYYLLCCLVNANELGPASGEHASSIRRVCDGAEVPPCCGPFGGHAVLRAAASRDIPLPINHCQLLPFLDVPHVQLAVKCAHAQLLSVGPASRPMRSERETNDPGEVRDRSEQARPGQGRQPRVRGREVRQVRQVRLPRGQLDSAHRPTGRRRTACCHAPEGEAEDIRRMLQGLELLVAEHVPHPHGLVPRARGQVPAHHVCNGEPGKTGKSDRGPPAKRSTGDCARKS